MDNSKIWDKILNFLKEQISPANFRTWFSQTQLGSIDDQQLILQVPSAFIKEQLSIRYKDLIVEACKQVASKELSLSFTINPSLASNKTADDETPFQFGSISTPNIQPSINPKYTLENFVVGLTNNLGYAAAQAVVQNPGISYNPLFIYGPSGVGKTHLMQAIGNAIFKKDPYLKLVYAPSERFTNDFVDAIQTRKTGDFRHKYRSCQLLLIDDIQFISGKDSTQEEFFHTFNELHSHNCQIVLTSDRPPTEMTRLESRLLSRFQGGLMVDIQLPDFDTRVAILKSKLQERGEHLPEDYLKLIAESVESNTRELEGKLIQVLQFYKLNKEPLSQDTVRKIVGKSSLSTASTQLDHRKVISTINQYFNIKISDLTGPRRQKQLVLPRQITMFILYEDCKIPMEKIGELLGGRDHTTVLYGIDKIRQAYKQDAELQRAITEIKQQIIS